MKALYLLLILLSAACCSLSAQEAEKTKRIDTLTVNGNVYYYHHYPTNKIYSAKNKIELEECCAPRVHNETASAIFISVIKKVFNTERIQELAEGRHMVNIRPYCNTRGDILEVELSFHKLKIDKEGDKDNISIKEIDMLNKELKKHKLDFLESCPDKKYYVTLWWFRFNASFLSE